MSGPILDPQEAFRHAMEAQLARGISAEGTARSVEPRARPLPALSVQDHKGRAIRPRDTDSDWWSSYRRELSGVLHALSLAQDDENRRAGDSQDQARDCEAS